MNDNTKNVLLSSDVIKKIKFDLKEIKLLSNEKEVKNKVEELIQFFDMNTDEDNNGISLEEKIRRKMKSTPDNDLNVKLYMLYRKLQNGKISESEALRLFELYCGTEYIDGYL